MKNQSKSAPYSPTFFIFFVTNFPAEIECAFQSCLLYTAIVWIHHSGTFAMHLQNTCKSVQLQADSGETTQHTFLNWLTKNLPDFPWQRSLLYVIHHYCVSEKKTALTCRWVGWVQCLWCRDDRENDAPNRCESTELRVGEGAEHHINPNVSVQQQPPYYWAVWALQVPGTLWALSSAVTQWCIYSITSLKWHLL